MNKYLFGLDGHGVRHISHQSLRFLRPWPGLAADPTTARQGNTFFSLLPLRTDSASHQSWLDHRVLGNPGHDARPRPDGDSGNSVHPGHHPGGGEGSGARHWAGLSHLSATGSGFYTFVPTSRRKGRNAPGKNLTVPHPPALGGRRICNRICDRFRPERRRECQTTGQD